MLIDSPMPYGNGAYIVHKILENNLPSYNVSGYNPYYTLFPYSLKLLYKASKKIDIIHTTPDYGSFFYNSSKPLILTFHNYMLDKFMQQYSSVLQKIHYRTDLKWFTNNALKKASEITAVSDFTAELVKKNLAYNGKIRVIYNGVDEKFFYPEKKQTAKRVKVLFAGNLTRRKGVDLLPEISKNLLPHIDIFYTSGLRTNNKKYLSENLINLGRIPYEKMPELYQSMDILLLPTVREGLPLVVLEAMACGLPVIATDCSSLPELIDNELGGYLCPLGDAKQFAEKINTLASSQTLVMQMGEYNREKINNYFKLEGMLQAYRLLFEEVMDNKI